MREHRQTCQLVVPLGKALSLGYLRLSSSVTRDNFEFWVLLGSVLPFRHYCLKLCRLLSRSSHYPFLIVTRRHISWVFRWMKASPSARLLDRTQREEVPCCRPREGVGGQGGRKDDGCAAIGQPSKCMEACVTLDGLLQQFSTTDCVGSKKNSINILFLSSLNISEYFLFRFFWVRFWASGQSKFN